MYRIYSELELSLRIESRKRLTQHKPDALAVPVPVNQKWSMDFMQDQLGDGWKFRTLNVLDDFNVTASFIPQLMRLECRLRLNDAI